MVLDTDPDTNPKAKAAQPAMELSSTEDLRDDGARADRHLSQGAGGGDRLVHGCVQSGPRGKALQTCLVLNYKHQRWMMEAVWNRTAAASSPPTVTLTRARVFHRPCG